MNQWESLAKHIENINAFIYFVLFHFISHMRLVGSSFIHQQVLNIKHFPLFQTILLMTPSPRLHSPVQFGPNVQYSAKLNIRKRWNCHICRTQCCVVIVYSVELKKERKGNRNILKTKFPNHHHRRRRFPLFCASIVVFANNWVVFWRISSGG